MSYHVLMHLSKQYLDGTMASLNEKWCTLLMERLPDNLRYSHRNGSNLENRGITTLKEQDSPLPEWGQRCTVLVSVPGSGWTRYPGWRVEASAVEQSES